MSMLLPLLRYRKITVRSVPLLSALPSLPILLVPVLSDICGVQLLFIPLHN